MQHRRGEVTPATLLRRQHDLSYLPAAPGQQASHQAPRQGEKASSSSHSTSSASQSSCGKSLEFIAHARERPRRRYNAIVENIPGNPPCAIILRSQDDSVVYHADCREDRFISDECNFPLAIPLKFSSSFYVDRARSDQRNGSLLKGKEIPHCGSLTMDSILVISRLVFCFRRTEDVLCKIWNFSS